MASDGFMPPLSYGVLLYYHFAEIEDPQHLKDWFASLCSRLSIVGRIRVSPGGVNVTVGGTMTSLHQHMDAVESHPLLQGCDFKLAAADSAPLNTAIAKEVGFDCLSVRVVKELVTLGLHPSKCPSISNAGEHLSAVNFHKKIERAAYKYSGGSSSSEGINNTNEDKELVILDVRNIYETRIGKFVPPEGVKFLDPKVRQYSDLPNWIDSNAEMLQDKCILMYCTGGVRCEMASAYLKTKGKRFDAIFQLSGGIQRYLEAFPSGGYFKGKNFVFDHRLAVASSSNEVIGSCMNCEIAFDDYSPRYRCSYCRMLLLICTNCQVNSVGGQQPVYTCELCRVSDKRPNLHKELQRDADSLMESDSLKQGGMASNVGEFFPNKQVASVEQMAHCVT